MCSVLVSYTIVFQAILTSYCCNFFQNFLHPLAIIFVVAEKTKSLKSGNLAANFDNFLMNFIFLRTIDLPEIYFIIFISLTFFNITIIF